ncbi:MAG: hypothetical protein KIT33_15680 [Candidatus Kapabacteria bacterium]|nr:hypothetical protein [Ignavibacteriota bacterium]MBX3045295.1 hypothetical protein [Ignavibacteriota bacterium]MCW5885789.1 hypothetical protein [Candidatus Kapabacteria bacterium]MCW5886411.1 hypothetical protein [Candidatus Kapabacteria bacterium]
MRAYHVVQEVFTADGLVSNDIAKDAFVDSNGNVVDYYYNLNYDNDFLAVGAEWDSSAKRWYIEV